MCVCVCVGGGVSQEVREKEGLFDHSGCIISLNTSSYNNVIYCNININIDIDGVRFSDLASECWIFSGGQVY